MTDFLKIAKSIAFHFAHICAYGVETVNKELNFKSPVSTVMMNSWKFIVTKGSNY